MASEAPVTDMQTLEAQEQDVEMGISKQNSQESMKKRPGSVDPSEKTVVAADQPAFDPNDPTLPLNWSTGKKYFNLTVPALLTFVV